MFLDKKKIEKSYKKLSNPQFWENFTKILIALRKNGSAYRWITTVQFIYVGHGILYTLWCIVTSLLCLHDKYIILVVLISGLAINWAVTSVFCSFMVIRFWRDTNPLKVSSQQMLTSAACIYWPHKNEKQIQIWWKSSRNS